MVLRGLLLLGEGYDHSSDVSPFLPGRLVLPSGIVRDQRVLNALSNTLLHPRIADTIKETPADAGGRISMSQAYVIEVHFETAGIVVRNGQQFQFFSSNRDYDALEGHNFISPRAAEAAAREHANKGRRRHSTQDWFKLTG